MAGEERLEGHGRIWERCGNQRPDNEGHILTTKLSLDFILEAMYKHQKSFKKGVIITFAFLERSCSFIASNKTRPYETN